MKNTKLKASFSNRAAADNFMIQLSQKKHTGIEGPKHEDGKWVVSYLSKK